MTDKQQTALAKRLASEVRIGMERTGQRAADLSRATGIGEPHISLLLRGQRAGTIAAWDALLRAAWKGAGGLHQVSPNPYVVGLPPDTGPTVVGGHHMAPGAGSGSPVAEAVAVMALREAGIDAESPYAPLEHANSAPEGRSHVPINRGEEIARRLNAASITPEKLKEAGIISDIKPSRLQRPVSNPLNPKGR